jgi:SAM-dependent methyltransferase
MHMNALVNPVPQDTLAREIGCQWDIALPMSAFLQDAHAAFRVALAQQRRTPLRFLDIGCGGGVKLLLAAEIFDAVAGLEFDPGYVACARKMLASLGADASLVMQGDARDFGDYADYDVLYFYQPMASTAGLLELERRVTQTARPGTVLMAPYVEFKERANLLNCAHVAGNVFVTGLAPKDAELLHTRAKAMGTEFPRLDQNAAPRTSFLRPVVLALFANGFVP